MPPLNELIFGLFLAYYWVGVEMVSVHTHDRVDRPQYVHGNFLLRIICGAIWPVVTKRNYEFTWFFIRFLSNAIFFIFVLALTYPYAGSYSYVLVGIMLPILGFIPIVSTLVILPMSFLATILWCLLAQPFGVEVPSRIIRAHSFSINGMNRN